MLLLGTLEAGACDSDISTSPNSPDPIGPDPSRAEVQTAAVGMLITLRGDFAIMALDMGIVGREALRFDGSDPRWSGELLHGPLDPGGFGSSHWSGPYTTIRAGNVILAILPTAEALTEEERRATAGYVRTIQALSYLLVLNTHTQDSIPIVTDTAVVAPPPPFSSNEQGFDHVVALLEDAKADLSSGGAAFPFSLPQGFGAFNSPATFLQFNRGLRARVAVYRNDFAGALAALSESFIDPEAPLDVGVYMDYGTGPGDFSNPLSLDPQQGENFAHPSLESEAQLQADGVTLDQRFLDKVVRRTVASADGLTSDLGWIRYPTPNTPIPIIKNEELILLRAEAFIGQGNPAAALPDLNVVRTRAGQLPPLTNLGTPEAALDELLYNKLYSLMFEGAHRWIDARHYGQLDSLPIDRPGDVVFPTLPIPTSEILPRL
jgi:hypothetical protein